MSAEQSLERRDDVRSWLVGEQPIHDALAESLRIASYPGSLAQNDVLDVVDRIIGDRAGIRRTRGVPDWEALADVASPTDDQLLFIDLIERDPAYRETLPHIETAVYAFSRGHGPTLMLNGHVDVVPIEHQEWTNDAFDPIVRDGRVLARGAMDMKAGLIAAAYSFAYLVDHWNGEGTILFAAVPEEETGGNGTLAVLAEGFVPDAVVFTEPTDLKVVRRHVGIQAFDVDVTGRPGGMLRRSWGTSAAPVLARAAIALEELEQTRTERAKLVGGYDDDDLPGYINFTMSSGDWLATRAASGHIEGLMSVLPGETQQEAEAELRSAVLARTADRGLDVRVATRKGGHRGAELPGSHRLVRSFETVGTDPTRPGAVTAAGTMVCDAKIIQGGGWAPAIVLGPIGGNLHSADEWVDLRSVSALVGLVVDGAERYFA